MCEELVGARNGGVAGCDLQRRRHDFRVVARLQQLQGQSVAYVELRDLRELQQVRRILVGRCTDAAIERLADDGTARSLQHLEHVRARPVAAARDLGNQPSHGAARGIDRGDSYAAVIDISVLGSAVAAVSSARLAPSRRKPKRLYRHEPRAEMRMARLRAHELREPQALCQRDQPLRSRTLEHASRVDPQAQEFVALAAAQLRRRCCTALPHRSPQRR